MCLSALSCLVVLSICHLQGDVPLVAYLIIIPISLIAFLLAMLIGFFLSQPLRDLNKKIKAYRGGNTSISFDTSGTLHEADCLTDDFKDLLDSSFAQCHDLSLREKRQARFVSDVAHELRTPLTAIHGTAELLEDPDMPPEMRTKFSQTIVNEAERLTRLVNDLLSLQHIEEDDGIPDLKRINLKPIVEEAVDALKPLLDERHANVEVIGEAPDVLGNRDRLKQVVNNLVENASRFIEPGGHIRVELYGLKGQSVIAVKDDGVGFGDVDPSLLFDRFYRTDFSRARTTGGTGLGLSIVKSVVDAHDGTVEAFNLPDGGACFVVAIPSVG